MSAWRIGLESGGAGPTATSADPPWKKYVDRLVKFIPGDAIGGYTGAITLFLLKDGKLPDPQLWLVVLFLVVTAGLVIIGWASMPNRPAFKKIVPDIVLAVLAFIAWSLTVPGNGWTDWKVVADNPGVPGLIGLLTGIFMPGIARILGR